jgi:hypothetical protein
MGLASNVVQFVEFAGALLSKTTQLYNSTEGSLRETRDLKFVSVDLRKYADLLKTPATQHDTDLATLAGGCYEIADELLAALAKLDVQGNPTKFESFRKAVRSAWSTEKVADIKKRLSSFRVSSGQMNFHMCADEIASNIPSPQAKVITDIF